MVPNPESKADMDRQNFFSGGGDKLGDLKRGVIRRIVVVKEENIGPFFWYLSPYIILESFLWIVIDLFCHLFPIFIYSVTSLINKILYAVIVFG